MKSGRKPLSILTLAVCCGMATAHLLRAQQPPAAAPPPAKPPGAPSKTWETEAEEAFVLKLTFSLQQAGGNSSLLMNGAKGDGYRLDFGPGSIDVYRIRAGKSTKLGGRPLPGAPSNTLVLTRRKTLLRGVCNGEIFFEDRSETGDIEKVALDNSSGRLKLLAEPRYQPTEEIYLTDDFMVQPGAESHWETVAGNWSVAGVSQPSGAADPFKFIGYTPGAGNASPDGISINRDSHWFWSDYQSDVAVRFLSDDTIVGIVFDYQGPQDYHCLTWGGAGAGGADANKVRLWRRNGNRVVPLAEREARSRSRQWYRLSVHRLGSRIAVFIDETQLLAVNDTHLGGGQCGLFERGDTGAEFDDFAARTVENTALLPARQQNSDVSWRERRFASDPFMESWGAAGSDWEPAMINNQRWFWYRGYFFNSLDIRIARPVDNAAGSGSPDFQEVAFFAAEDGSQSYRLRLAPGRLALFKNEQQLAAVDSEEKGDVRLTANSGKIEVLVARKTVLQYTDAAPLTSGRVGILAAGYAQAAAIAGAVAITSADAREYRFDVAPTDWEIEAGEWQTTNRWACVPDWNFYGGRGEPIATVWNKRRFGGDLWIDAFLAPREGSTDRMHFTQPVNLNLTFNATGTVLGSGYSLVFRSHDRSTLLYRAGKPVAESKNVVIENWRDDTDGVYARIAQTWQHFQILKQGGHIRVWIEVAGAGYSVVKRQLLLDYTDNAPLTGDRTALWTWGRNGMSVARLTLSASRSAGMESSALADTVPGTPNQPQQRVAIRTGVTPARPGELANVERRVNDINGGWFRTDLIQKPLSLRDRPVVNFDFTAGSNVALGLYAVVDGQRFRADFLGKIDEDGDAVPMGSVKVTKVDAKWRRASFPLLQALREFYPQGEMPSVQQLYLADLSSNPEHVGGLTVNSRGAVFEKKPVMNASPAAAPPAAPQWELRGAAGATLPDGTIRLGLVSETVDPADYRVNVNGSTLAAGDRGLHWNGMQRELELDLAAAGLTFTDAQEAVVKVTRGDTAVTFTRQWKVAYAADKTPPAAPVVKVGGQRDRVDDFESGMGAWQRLGGEQGATLWRVANENDAAVGEGPSGKYHLRLYHRELSGMFGALIRDKPFDARRWPAITFDYRLHPMVKLSLLCEIGNRTYEFRFSGDGYTFPIIGSIGNVRKDNKWHRAELDILGALRNYGVTNTVISRMYFANTGIMNNMDDVEWALDNFRFVPALPENKAGAAMLQWSALDSSGIAGYSRVMDNAAETVPAETVTDAATSAAAMAGTTYLHVRAKDRAGNWGPATHFRYAWMPANNEAKVAPIANEATDANQTLAAPLFELKLQGAETIDVESVRARVRATYANGAVKGWEDYDLTGRNLQFDLRQGALRWRDAAFAVNEAAAKPYTLECEVRASNLAGEPVLNEQLKWQVQPALDTQPPAAPYVSYIPANRLCRYDFEREMPYEVQLRRSAWVMQDTGNGATGGSSVKVVNLAAFEFFSMFLRKRPIPVHQYSHVSFDYRFDANRYNLNLTTVVNGNLQVVKLTDSGDWYSAFIEGIVGRVPDFRTDGQWHNANFDFLTMLKKRYPDTQRFYAESLETWATGIPANYNPQGARMWLDNITFYSTAADSAAFEWQAPLDDSGIKGYAATVDQQPGTVPEPQVSTTSTRAEFKELQPGKWFFHVRACDSAGNWGPATHTAFELTKAG